MIVLEVTPEIQIPMSELRYRYDRSGGPGGQNVNKLNTKVTLHWPVRDTLSLPEDVRERFMKKYHRRINKAGELVINSQRYRDQAKNVADCQQKLRDLVLDVSEAPTERKKTRRTRASQRRRLQEKKARSTTKQNRRPPSLE